MSDLVGNPEDRVSRVAAHLQKGTMPISRTCMMKSISVRKPSLLASRLSKNCPVMEISS